MCGFQALPINSDSCTYGCANTTYFPVIWHVDIQSAVSSSDLHDHVTVISGRHIDQSVSIYFHGSLSNNAEPGDSTAGADDSRKTCCSFPAAIRLRLLTLLGTHTHFSPVDTDSNSL